MRGVEDARQGDVIDVTRRFLEVFNDSALKPPPIWLMRQAGRYLPEYREVRSKAGGFLDLCYSPSLAAEVTLQPIRRYGFDAAILFADILIVPDALGQEVRFVEGEGPRLDPIQDVAGLSRLDQSKVKPKFSTICETVSRLRQDLPGETALIGFAGAPWTVATYMVDGKGTKDQAGTRLWAYRDPDAFGQLIETLVQASIEYLDGQIQAGADAIQVFDSWAGNLAPDEFSKWVIEPTRKIVSALKERHPALPIIGFPRGASALLKQYVDQTGVDGVSCDTATPMMFARNCLGASKTVLQGNLDPLLLVAGGDRLLSATDQILDDMDGAPFIFNLGHGIVPQTPPEHVAVLVDHIRRRH